MIQVCGTMGEGEMHILNVGQGRNAGSELNSPNCFSGELGRCHFIFGVL